MKVGTGTITHTRGCSVTVLYRPDRPTDARFNTFLHLWFFPLALTAGGTVALAVGSGVWHFAQTGDHRLIFAMAFTGGGGLFAGIGMLMFLHTIRLLARTVGVRGIVVGGMVEFEDVQGGSHRLALTGCCLPAGAPVTVRYDRANPGSARVVNLVEMWMFPIMFTGLGTPLLALGIVFWLV